MDDFGLTLVREIFSKLGPSTVTSGLGSNAAWQLLDGCVRHRMQDGTIFVADTASRWHSLQVRDGVFPTATAKPRDNHGGQAILMQPLCEMVRTLSLGLWSDRDFLPQVGTVHTIPEVPFANTMPSLIETYAIAALERKRPDISATSHRLIDQTFQRLDTKRQHAALKTCQFALQWLWAHELGHLVLGHMSDSIRLLYHEEEKALGFEIFADKFAYKLLFSKVNPQRVEPILLAVSGALIVLSLIEAEVLVMSTPWSTTTHPGCWFRAQLMLREIGGLAADLSIVASHATRVAQALGQFGNWIPSAFEIATEEMSEKLHQDTLKTLEPHLKQFQDCHAMLQIDTNGSSTDFRETRTSSHRQ